MSILSTLLIATTAFIPQTNQRTVELAPLQTGEMAFMADDDALTAKLVVGADGAIPYVVTDPTALHGYGYTTLTREQYFTTYNQNVTFTNGVWGLSLANGSTNVITVTCKEKISIADAKINLVEQHQSGLSLPPEMASTYITIEGNIVSILVIAGTYNTQLAITDIIIRKLNDGEQMCENDTTVRDFTIVDRLGRYELSNLRTWVKNLDLSDNWSKHVAQVNPNLNGRYLASDTNSTFLVGQRGDNFVVSARGLPALSINSTGAGTNTADYAVLRIAAYSINSTNHNHYVTYYQNIQGFDPDELVVVAAQDLKGPWITLLEGTDYSHDTANSRFVIYPSVTQYNHFFKLGYGGSYTPASVFVTINGSLKVIGDFVLKGEDGAYYKISVNNSVISATPAN